MKVELVSNLKRKATEILGELDTDKEPALITQHGRPAAYLLDVSTYEGMEGRADLAVSESDSKFLACHRDRTRRWTPMHDPL